MLNLWNKHSLLKHWDRREIQKLANKYQRCGYRFVPFVSKEYALACSLDILFLRRDDPGNLIKSGGDIDNRLKVLFDGLRMPQECGEIEGFEKQPD